MGNMTIFTVGHSTRSLEDFAQLLQGFHIDAVVDIRTIPRSRTNPDYNLDVMPKLLSRHAIEHHRIAALGGLRKKSRSVAEHTNGLWHNQSFHNYADYALSDEFERGLCELLALGNTRRCAIMCSEAVWWRCHRRIVADYLLLRDVDVIHIMGAGKATRATLTPGAEACDLQVTYPAPA